MEKTFRRLNCKEARKAYNEAELVNGLAHQIRILRKERGWSQASLAAILKTTQGVVSRLEDPSYGRYSLKTLLALAEIFDVALFAKFLPYSKFIYSTWDTTESNFHALPYEKEASEICFYETTSSIKYIAQTQDSNQNKYIEPALIEAKVASDFIPLSERTLTSNSSYFKTITVELDSNLELHDDF